MSKVKKVFTVISIVFLIICFVAVTFVISGFGSNRFSLKARNTIGRTIGVLVALDKGKREEAEKVFKGIKKEILSKGFRGEHSVHSRAMLVYFLLRIKSAGLEVEDKVIDKIEPFSLTVTEISRVWYYLTHKEREKLGVELYVKWENPPSAPDRLKCDCCGYNQETWGYIAWKFGKGKRPTKDDWAIVP